MVIITWYTLHVKEAIVKDLIKKLILYSTTPCCSSKILPMCFHQCVVELKHQVYITASLAMEFIQISRLHELTIHEVVSISETIHIMCNATFLYV